jgi:hypothetical protein
MMFFSSLSTGSLDKLVNVMAQERAADGTRQRGVRLQTETADWKSSRPRT